MIYQVHISYITHRYRSSRNYTISLNGLMVKFCHSVFDLFSCKVKNSAIRFSIYLAVWIRSNGQVWINVPVVLLFGIKNKVFSSSRFFTIPNSRQLNNNKQINKLFIFQNICKLQSGKLSCFFKNWGIIMVVKY